MNQSLFPMMRLINLLLFILLVSPLAASENWPGWRGPRGDGSVAEAPNLAVKFDPATDAIWKTAIPGIGHASPVIWEDRIFLVTAEEGKRSLLSLDRVSGKILWSEVVLEAPARLILVDAMNCVLERGTAVAEVGESAKGFTIRTPSARVIDYGTRFAVNVDSKSGATQTQVFDGLVEVEEPESKKRIALREGQQALVTGASLGGISEGVEEGTWSNPESPVRPKGPGMRTLTTADPGGTDAYVWGGKPTTHTSETLLLLKNGLGEDAPHRKAFLRFPLDTIAPGQITSARLELRFTPTGWGLASHLGDSEFTVYGLIDDSLDGWDAATLGWSNAPGQDPAGGNAVRKDQVRKLGRLQRLSVQQALYARAWHRQRPQWLRRRWWG